MKEVELMNTDQLMTLVERFNESNDRFAIAMNFLAAGIERLQAFIRQVEEKHLRPDRALLDEALQLIDFASEQLVASSNDKRLRGFAERYRVFVSLLRESC